MLTKKRFRDEDSPDEDQEGGYGGAGSKRRGDPNSVGGGLMKEGGDSKTSSTS